MVNPSIRRLVELIMILLPIVLNAGGRDSNKQFFIRMSILDSIAHRSIDTQKVYRNAMEARRSIDSLVEWEYAMLTDSFVTKSSINYSDYMAHRYANEARCYWRTSKRELRKRWIVRREYRTVKDTVFEERKSIIGVNLGANRNPVGTDKPIVWHTKHCYDSCQISLKGCSNLDGDDNFQLYTFKNHSRDTLCDVRMARSVGVDLPIFSKEVMCAACSPIYLRVYNRENRNYAPGAFSAILIVRPKHPKIIVMQKIKGLHIAQIR